MNSKDDYEIKFDKILGETIRENRKARKRTQEEAAAKSDKHRQWIGDLENGKKTPSIYTLYKYTAYNQFDLPQVLQKTIEKFEQETKSQMIAADQKKWKDYIHRIKDIQKY